MVESFLISPLKMTLELRKIVIGHGDDFQLVSYLLIHVLKKIQIN